MIWNQKTKTPQKPKTTSRNQLSHYESRSLTTKTLLWENPHLPKTIKTNDPTVYYYSIKQKKMVFVTNNFQTLKENKKAYFLRNP
jgi:DNA-directed RNA polymerase subunit H (RpoH/RPB5)